MKMDKTRLTLDQTLTYQIKVPGVLDDIRAEPHWDLRILQECDEQGLRVSVFIATLDQAALHSLLRRLYSMGLPLISIQIIEGE
jgi:hypothetical protein